MGLLAELKRRNVIRMAGLYLVGAWLMVQVAATLLPAFEAPSWVLKALVGLLALGFIPALVGSWVFEFTADGIKRDSELGPAEAAGSAATARRLDLTVIVLLLVAIGLIFWRRSEAPAAADAGTAAAVAAASTAAPRSIAVLAFDDLSAEGDQAYFAEGVSEELLNLLARIDGLKVAARTSSFKFKDAKVDIGEIGRALNVDTVLEGSVRKAGDQVRVTAQLIRVADGFHIWSDSYDRKLENIFAVQDEIAQAIVAELKLKLDLARETAGRTENLAAYDLYLRGREQARAPTRDGLQQAITLFEQALAIDPGYAAAHSGIAEAWIWLEDYGGFRSTEAFPKAEQAAQRALALDPDSAEANAAMAFVQDRYYNDLQQAQTLFERTLAINPNYVIAYNMYADTLRDMGQPRRMVEVQRRSVELDPLSTFFRARLASRLMDTGAVAESEQLIQALLKEDPDSDYALEELGNLRRQQGRMAEAAANYRRVHASRPGDPYSAAQISILGARLDDGAMADAWVAAARARGENNRWELQAREMIAIWRGDWPALDAISTRLGGERGAYLRGMAAIGEQRWPDARQALSEALRLGGYREGQALFLQNIPPLLLLAWLERQDQQPGWQPRLAEAEAFLQRAEAEGGLVVDTSSTRMELARAAAVAGDRERSLGHLRFAIANLGSRDHWFLERDPLFAAWRDDAEFTALVATMRAAAAAERKQIAADGLQRPTSP